MAEKPKAAYMGKVLISGITCRCGSELERIPGGYVCRSPACEWRNKPMAAVIMPSAAMYAKEPAD